MIRGRESIRKRIGTMLSAFNPLRLTIEQVHVDSPVVVTYWKIATKHTGEFLGIPPTGKVVTVRGSSMLCFEDSLIREARDHWDVQSLLAELRH